MNNKTSQPLSNTNKRTGNQQSARGSSDPSSLARPLRPTNPPTLDKSVIDTLTIVVEQAELAVGNSLPTEQVLASNPGVCRSIISKALKAWQSLGIVTRSKSAGRGSQETA